jgi:cysteine-S-conjugate beta-lyase
MFAILLLKAAKAMKGCNGLFSLVLKRGNTAALTALLDGMEHFSMGYSWGGFESLILANENVNSIRTAKKKEFVGPMLRLHVGLEDVDDLIRDLEKGFERFNTVLEQ